MSGHHPLFSPSSAHRWLECTASVNRIAELGIEEEETEYQAEGRLAHKVFEFRLKFPSQLQIAEYVTDEERSSTPVPSDMKEYVDTAAKYVEKWLDDDTSMLLETTVEVPGTGIFGTADVILMREDKIRVFDFKYGKGVRVVAKDNPQLLLYLLGAVEVAEMSGFSPTKLAVHIVQPRLDHFDSATVSLQRLGAFKELVVERMQEVFNGAQYRPGEETCRWCPLKGNCEALYAHSYKAVLDSLDEEPDAMSDEQLAGILDKVSLVISFLDAARKEAVSRILSKREVPGWKVVEGRTQRRWRDEEEVLKLLAKVPRLGIDRYAPRKLLSPRAVQGLLRDDSPGRAKILQQIVRPEGRPTLAPVTDTRPNFSPITDEDFADETDTE